MLVINPASISATLSCLQIYLLRDFIFLLQRINGYTLYIRLIGKFGVKYYD